MISIYPSLISSDIMNLERNIKDLEPYCQGFHLNIMDFHFVPDLEWSINAVNRIRKSTDKKIHVHLMVEYPERYISLLKLNPYDIVSIHVESESTEKFEQLLKDIQLKQFIPSIAINPFTPIESVISIKFPLEHVLILSSNPDDEKSEFLPHALERVKQLSLFKKSHNLSFNISIEGGINADNLKSVAQTGANEIVITSAIFGHINPIERLKIIDLTKTI